jgi:surfeit locus 1 family protein
MFSRRWWWTTLLVIVAAAVMVRLGLWQVERHQQRQAFIAHVRAMQDAPPLGLGGRTVVPADLISMEYRVVKVMGTYDFEHQVAIRNQVWTQSWGDEMGYALLTPLQLEDGSAVLVERGWIPSKYDTPDSWRQFDEPGRVTVEGMIRQPLSEGEMGSLQDPNLAPGQERLDFWIFVNIDRLQQQMPYPLLPVYIERAPDEAQQSSPPYSAAPVLDVSESTHLGYAGQWFLYTALLLVGYPVYLRKRESEAAQSVDEAGAGS